VNVSDDLEALLEHGELEGACARYEAAPDDRRLKLLCGKAMFFHESFETGGLPESVFDHLAVDYPDALGLAYAQIGLVPDPFADSPRPLGFAPTVPMDEAGTVPALAFTCASCHFARLPDGRYAVGAPNHDYDYGLHILALGLYPMVAFGMSDGDHAEEALDRIAPLLERHASDAGVQSRLLTAVLPLAGLDDDAMALPPEIERQYATWPTGTQDFNIQPLPLDDGVHLFTKFKALWGMPEADEVEAAGMPHEMLAWTGVVPSLMTFVEGFAAIGGADAWPQARLAPLVEYIYSLRPPENLDPPPADQVARGHRAFVRQGCIDCHDGPRGSGRRVFDFDEIGTDDQLARWMDPELSGEPCCGLTFDEGIALTHGVKSPRLSGLWAMGRFLHNGMVPSLEALLCLEGERPTVTEPAYSDGGHLFGCDLPVDTRLDLIAYLRAH
jgi:hypothetical protein